jgi:hypothetical protein
MTTKKKYYYRKLKPEEGRQYLINAFSKGSTLTLWESGNVDKKVTIEFSFKDPNAKSLSIVVDDNSLPKEWRHASLLYHLIDSSFSFLGKVLSETKKELSNNKIGIFEAWYTELGFSKKQVYRWINRYEFILCQNDTIPPGAFIEPWNVNVLPETATTVPDTRPS